MNNINNKMLVLLLKYLPIVYAMGIFVGTSLTYFDVFAFILNISIGSSLISAITLHVANRAFKYCYWHKLLIYYIYGFISTITADYFINSIEIYLDYSNYILIVSLIVFVIAYINRNKERRR